MAKRRNYKKTNYAKKAKFEAAKGNYQDAAEDAEKSKGLRDSKETSRDPMKPRNGNKFPSCVLAGNDPEWYFTNLSTLEDVASFSYSHPLGTNIHPERHIIPTTTELNAGCVNTIPGVMGITVALVPGVSIDAQSPVNLAAQNMYSKVRYDNSGAANYDPPDLMLYLLAMDSLYAAWSWMKRIYGYASKYSAENKYRPLGYAKVENIDLDDIYDNLADFRAYLNMAASRISSFRVPATLTYNVRHAWMFSNIYTDSETTKAQEYMFTPCMFHQYDETSSPKGGLLKAIPVSGLTTPWTFAALKSLLNGMINALQYSSDIGNMSGDIKKAFGDSLFMLGSIDKEYVVEPVYRREVLSEIENLLRIDIPMADITAGEFNIGQNPNTNFISFQPSITEPLLQRSGGYLNFHWNNPTAKDVIEASRFMWNGDAIVEGTTHKILITSCGSEIVSNVNVVFWYNSDAQSVMSPLKPNAPMKLGMLDVKGWINVDVSDTTVTASNSIQDAFIQLWMLNAFDWSPYVILQVSGSTSSYFFPPLRDWDVYTELDEYDIESLNL